MPTEICMCPLILIQEYSIISPPTQSYVHYVGGVPGELIAWSIF